MNLSNSHIKIGQKQSHLDPCSNKLHYNHHKIPPLPVFRKNLLNSSRLRGRLQIDGYKFFAKLPASGPETLKILQGVKRLRSIKWVRRFEFDPYLCDHSHINHLRVALRYIKHLKRLNLVIRRVDFPKEVEGLSPFISRFLRLKAIRVELPRTQNVDEDSFVSLYKAIGNCCHIRFFELKAIEMPEKSLKAQKTLENCIRRLKWLEGWKAYEILKKGALKSQADESKKKRPIRQFPVKILDVIFSSTGEWANKGMESEVREKITKTMGKILQRLEKIKLHAIKTTVGFEDIVNFFFIAALIPTLTHAEYELLNCQISDMEVMAFAHGLTKAKQLEYFSLKVIQKASISEEYIEKFAEVLSKLDNLSKFDVYFRRLDLHPQGIKNLGKRIENFENLQCSCSKESIHIYKRSVNG